MAKARLPIGCWSIPAPCKSVKCRNRFSTTWNWNATGNYDQGPRRGHEGSHHGGQEYELNLIDTPGHVDFQYEVSRSLNVLRRRIAAGRCVPGCRGQTVATAYAAIEQDLIIIPVINKIDLQYQRADEVAEEMEHALGVDLEQLCESVRKSGMNIDQLMDAIIKQFQPPTGDRQCAVASDGV